MNDKTTLNIRITAKMKELLEDYRGREGLLTLTDAVIQVLFTGLDHYYQENSGQFTRWDRKKLRKCVPVALVSEEDTM